MRGGTRARRHELVEMTWACCSPGSDRLIQGRGCEYSVWGETRLRQHIEDLDVRLLEFRPHPVDRLHGDH